MSKIFLEDDHRNTQLCIACTCLPLKQAVQQERTQFVWEHSLCDELTWAEPSGAPTHLTHLRASLRCLWKHVPIAWQMSLRIQSISVMFQCNTAYIHVVPMKPRISCRRDYHPVPLTPVIMRCLGLLVKTHKDSLPLSYLDGLRFARSKYISCGYTHLPGHMWTRRAYLWEYCCYSAAGSMCNWTPDLLTGRPLVVKIGTSSTNSRHSSLCQYSVITHNCGAAQPPHFHQLENNTKDIGIVTYWVCTIEQRESYCVWFQQNFIYKRVFVKHRHC